MTLASISMFFSITTRWSYFSEIRRLSYALHVTLLTREFMLLWNTFQLCIRCIWPNAWLSKWDMSCKVAFPDRQSKKRSWVKEHELSAKYSCRLTRCLQLSAGIASNFIEAKKVCEKSKHCKWVIPIMDTDKIHFCEYRVEYLHRCI